jgi:hypothetical protein
MEIGHHQAPDRTPQRNTTQELNAIVSNESQEQSKTVTKKHIMPGGGGSSTGTNPTRSPARDQPDIRNFLSPPRPPRNKRIIESDSSEQDNQNGGAAIPAGIQPQLPQREAGQENEHPQPELNPPANTPGNAPPPVIDILDSDSSDSMFIPRMRSRTAEALRDHQHENQRQRLQTPQRQRQSPPQRQRPLTPRQQNQTPAPAVVNAAEPNDATTPKAVVCSGSAQSPDRRS